MIKGLKLLVFFLSVYCSIGFSQQEQIEIKGVVRDSANRPVPYTNVTILNSNIGAITNDSGYFSLNIPYGKKVTLAFSYVGFVTELRTVLATSKSNPLIKVTIAPNIKILDEVQITASERSASGIEKVNMRDFSRLPNPSGNIESIIKTLPGVVSNNELSSQYSVRGGSFDENLVYVNDVEIQRPILMRSGQQEGLSFVNSQLVSAVKFSAGGFESRYGDKMSSVLDVTYRLPERFQLTTTASMLGGALTCEGISKNKKFTQITGARYKTSRYLLKTFDTQGEYNPEFVDVQTLIGYKISKKIEVSFLGNLSQNKFEFIPQSRNTTFGTWDTVYNLKMYFDGKEVDKYLSAVGALTVSYRPSTNLQLKTIISGYSSSEKETFDIDSQYLINQLDNSIGSSTYKDSILNIGVGGLLKHARNFLWVDALSFSHIGVFELPNHSVRWSAQLKQEVYFDKRNEWELYDSAGYALPYYPNRIVIRNPINARNEYRSMHFSGYLQDTWEIVSANSLWFINGGLRFHYWSFNKEILVSPRFRVSMQPSGNKNVLFYMASGIYYQLPTYNDMRLPNGTINQSIKSPRSIHFVVGNDLYLKLWDRPFKLTTEAYYKDIVNLIPYKIDNVRMISTGENLAKGYAYGIDSKLNGEFIPGLESWLSLSLLSTKEDFKDDSYINDDGITVYPDYYRRPTDQRFTLNLFFQDYLPNNPTIQIHLNLVYGSGLPVSPTHSQRYDLNFPMGAYRRVDIGLSKILIRRENKFLKDFILGLEMFNLLNINNKSSYLWVRTVNNQSGDVNELAVPNFLTARRLNFKITAKF